MIPPSGSTSDRDLATPAADLDSDLVRAADSTVRQVLHPAIYNHTVRVLHLAAHLAGEQPPDDPEALAVAVLFHDSGTAAENDGDQRFEVEGADAAARFLEVSGWAPDRIRPVWEAIALHTSPGIAERFGPLARLLRTAVLVDLGRIELPVDATPELEAQLARLPRLSVDQVLVDAVVTQALQPGREAKAPPFSWPGALLADRLAGLRGEPDGATTGPAPEDPAPEDPAPEDLAPEDRD